MKYMGSKRKLAKYIIPEITKLFSSDRYIYIEPFVGGANIIDKVKVKNRIGYDKNPYLIALLDHISKSGKLPETISEDEYYKVRDNKSNFPKWYVGLVGFCASYGGRFFEGYPRGNKEDGTPRDYTNEAIRNIEKQRASLKNIGFYHSDYIDLDFSKEKAVIYCDPPYRNSKPYKTGLLGVFDSDKFWRWAEKQSEYNPVFISEYEAPENFKCVFSISGISSNLRQIGTKKSIEKLFLHKRWGSES